MSLKKNSNQSNKAIDYLKNVLSTLKLESRAQYIYRDSPYNSLYYITNKDNVVVFSYCGVNNQLMYPAIKMVITDKELVYTYKIRKRELDRDKLK